MRLPLNTPFVTQVSVLAASTGVATPAITEASILAAAGQPQSRFAWVTELSTLAAGTGLANTEAVVTELWMLAATKSDTLGSPVRSRCGAFVLDGHSMYAVDLGEEGTFVFDATTRTWTRFATAGYYGWNFAMPYQWTTGAHIVGGDAVASYVLTFDAENRLDDEWREIDDVVTGLLPARARQPRRVFRAELHGSVSSTMAADATVVLRTSRDGGETWQEYPARSFPSTPEVRLQWHSLGMLRPPGLVLQFVGLGGMLRVDALTLEVEGGDT